jgi:hypothetical protein
MLGLGLPGNQLLGLGLPGNQLLAPPQPPPMYQPKNCTSTVTNGQFQVWCP